MQTFLGVKFHPLAPKLDDIHIVDIAHALSQQCRFAGHTKSFYSVAQHSVLVSQYCNPEDALWGLLHDATEAYLVDVPTPVKMLLSEYKEIERDLQTVLCEKFQIAADMPESVHFADRVILSTEARDMMGPPPELWPDMPPPLQQRITGWTSYQAKKAFLLRFAELGGYQT